MQDRVRVLANLIKQKHRTSDQFVLMLGAGASMSSGVKATTTIMTELAGQFGTGSGTDAERFDRLWATAPVSQRAAMLEPYLKQAPSGGYEKLAELIRLGHIDVVMTFNFDRLVEQSLDAIGFNDYKVIIRGEHEPHVIGQLLRERQPRVKILKLHGSLQSTDFLFSKEEMLNYPDPLVSIIRELTGRDIIVCGYAFADTCVIRAFNDSRDAGSIYFVNPAGATEGVKSFLFGRRSPEKVISGKLGEFDRFFETLHELVTRRDTEAPQTRQNPFKFIDHYLEEERSYFAGRRGLSMTIARRVSVPQGATLFLYGGSKVGKTSFVRAGLIACLDARERGDQWQCLYVRCRPNITQFLWDALRQRYGLAEGPPDWPAAFERMKAGDRRTLLVLDQFERVCRLAVASPEQHAELRDLVTMLEAQADGRLSILLVAVGDLSFWKVLAQVPPPAGGRQTEEIRPLSANRVARLIRFAARKGGVTLDPELVEKYCKDYSEGLADPDGKQAFTLMHLQTICYYVARGFRPPDRGYGALPQGLSAVLDAIRDDKSSLLELLDDLPPDDRRLIRRFLKAICDPDGNPRTFIEFIRQHFPQLKEDRYPEPLP